MPGGVGDRRWGWVAAAFMSASAAVYAQDGVQTPARGTDVAALDVVRGQAREQSAASTYLFQLTDVQGPRLTGSREFRNAARWAAETLGSMGLDHVELLSATSADWSEPGWSCRRYAVRIVEPSFATLAAIPSPWSAPIEGRRVGEPVLFQTPGRAGVPVDEIIARYEGTLKNKVLMLTDQVRPIGDAWRPVSQSDLTFRRLADADLTALRQPIVPEPKPPAPPAPPTAPSRPPRTREEEDNDTRKLYAFLREEGVIGWLNPTIGDHGTIVAFGPFGRPGFEPPPPPGFNLSVESYNRILRLMQHNVPVKLELELESELLDDKGHTSVLAELRGRTKPEEVVLAGAHLDSWHVGAGATDNGANCAVLMEAMRILKAAKLPLSRTVRIALWAGEERGLRGSAAYVKRLTGRPTEKLYLYLNADSGAGRYRGLQVQQRLDFAPVAERWLAPFKADGQGFVSVRKSSGSDQLSFERAGLPTAVFLQDPLHGPRTYHTNMDLVDYVLEEDLKQSAALLAWVLFRAANE
jgi:carboxypeptidase Q